MQWITVLMVNCNALIASFPGSSYLDRYMTVSNLLQQKLGREPGQFICVILYICGLGNPIITHSCGNSYCNDPQLLL